MAALNRPDRAICARLMMPKPHLTRDHALCAPLIARNRRFSCGPETHVSVPMSAIQLKIAGKPIEFGEATFCAQQGWDPYVG